MRLMMSFPRKITSENPLNLVIWAHQKWPIWAPSTKYYKFPNHHRYGNRLRRLTLVGKYIEPSINAVKGLPDWIVFLANSQLKKFQFLFLFSYRETKRDIIDDDTVLRDEERGIFSDSLPNLKIHDSLPSPRIHKKDPLNLPKKVIWRQHGNVGQNIKLNPHLPSEVFKIMSFYPWMRMWLCG